LEGIALTRKSHVPSGICRWKALLRPLPAFLDEWRGQPKAESIRPNKGVVNRRRNVAGIGASRTSWELQNSSYGLANFQEI
jgi:hypothetical protein